MDLLLFITNTLLLIIVMYAIYFLVLWGMRRYSAKTVTQAELQEAGRKIQLVDVRETPEFEAKHILGARNIPSSQFSMRYKELRKDQPIYLYDDNFSKAARAAFKLKRNGYQHIFVLKGGIMEWTGKTRSSKK